MKLNFKKNLTTRYVSLKLNYELILRHRLTVVKNYKQCIEVENIEDFWLLR